MQKIIAFIKGRTPNELLFMMFGCLILMYGSGFVLAWMLGTPPWWYILIVIGATAYLLYEFLDTLAPKEPDFSYDRYDFFKSVQNYIDSQTGQEAAYGEFKCMFSICARHLMEKRLAAPIQPTDPKLPRVPDPYLVSCTDFPDETKRIHVLGDCFLTAYLKFFNHFPHLNKGEKVFEVPLLSAVSVQSIDEFFKVIGHLFPSELEAYFKNHYACEAAIKERWFPRFSLQHVKRLVRDTEFEMAFAETVPVCIPLALRYEGVWVIAPPGRGKTTLLSQLLAQDLSHVSAGAASVILMDSKGGLIDHAKKLAIFAPGGLLEGKLVLIEPRPDLALNPLDLGASAGHKLDLSEYILDGLLDMATTPKQGAVFRRVLVGVNSIPNATFETLLKFLHDSHPYDEYLKTLDPDDRDFFLLGNPPPFDGKEYRGTRDELTWRIDGMMTKIPLVRSMLKAPKTLLDIGKEMDSGKVIIIDNTETSLAGGTEFFSRFFVALILAAAQQRAKREEDEKLPCFLYIDECDTAIRRDVKVAEIIQRCRSQNIGVVLAHQSLTQIENDRVVAALADCAVRLANSDGEASQLAPKWRTTPEFLRSLEKGQFALFMRDITKWPLAVDVSNNPVSGWPKMTEGQFADIQKQMAERYSYSKPVVVEAPKGEEPDTGPASWG